MQANNRSEDSLLTLLAAWAAHGLSSVLKAARSKVTAERAAAEAALSGNPTGF